MSYATNTNMARNANMARNLNMAINANMATNRPGTVDADTYLMARNHTLWPAFATAAPNYYKTATAAMMWGGVHQSTIGVQHSYWEWANLALSPGDYTIYVLCWPYTDYGTMHVLHDGVDTGARLDLNGFGTTPNQVLSDTFTIAAKTRGPLRLSMSSTTGAGYHGNVMQVGIIKTSAGLDAGTDGDDLPWTVDVPCADYLATTGGTWGTVGSDSYTHGQTTYCSSIANGNWIEYDAWIPAGTWTLTLPYYRATNSAIVDVSIGGAVVGSIDMYGSNGPVTGTITGISVATTGIHRIRLAINGKHASSSAYNVQYDWLHFRRTA